MKRPYLTVFALVPLLVVIGVYAFAARPRPLKVPCPPSGEQTSTSSSAGKDKPTTPLRAHLDTCEVGPLGGTMTLVLTVASHIPWRDASGRSPATAEAFFQLPDTIVPKGNETRRPVKLDRDVPQTFEIKVILAHPGEYKVSGGIRYEYPDGSVLGASDTLFVDVTSHGTEVRRGPFPE